jgi:hypothetical protein
VSGLNFEVVEDIPGEAEVSSSAMLTVAEFVSQPEIEELARHASQIYGYIKKGLPCSKEGGTTLIPFDEGYAWLVEYKKTSKRGGKTIKYKVTDGPVSEQRLGRGINRTADDLSVGDYLRWDRQNKLGPAYGRVYQLLDTLVCVTVEYRTRPVYLSRAQTSHDLKTGEVMIVSQVETDAFLMHQFARLDFLLHMTKGKEAAQRIKEILLKEEIVEPDMTDRFYESEFRRWPKKEHLQEAPDASNGNEALSI